MKAQSSVEFLLMLAAIFVAFALAYVLYSDLVLTASSQRDSLEANALCLRVSSTLGSLSSLPGNSSYRFDLPRKLNGKDYTVRIASAYHLVKIDYGTAGMGCRLQLRNVTNSTGSQAFILSRNATATSAGGNVIVQS